MLLHDPADKPDMKDQGFVVAPGTHTLVTILQKQVQLQCTSSHAFLFNGDDSFYIDLSTWQIKFAISMIFVISFDTSEVLIINIVNSLRMFYQFEDP